MTGAGLADGVVSVTLTSMFCELPTMPKRGAVRHLKPAVELAFLAGQKRVHRSIEAERRGRRGHVMHLAVGDHDHAREPVGRHVGQRLAEIGEQHGAVALAVGRGRGGMHPAHVEIGDRFELVLEGLADLVGARGASGDRLALAVVDHDRKHVVQRLAILLLQMRVGDGEQEEREAEEAQHRAAPRAPEEKREQALRRRRQCPTGRARERRARTRPTSSLAHCPNRSSRAGTCT